MENKNQVLNEEMENIITLTDESGNDIEFEFLDLIEYNGEEYVVLLPIEVSEDESGEVVILRIADSGNSDEEEYCSVDDEIILNAVFNIFKEKFKENFNFMD